MRTNTFIMNMWFQALKIGLEKEKINLSLFYWDSSDEYTNIIKSIINEIILQFRYEINFYIKGHMRRKAFKETVAIARKGGYYSEHQKYIELPNPETMKKGTRFYTVELPPCNNLPLTQDTAIDVINEDSILAAKRLKDNGFNPAVLNMASRQNPGGSVLNGAGAQEENLFRRTNLFLSMYQFTPYAAEYGLARSRYQYPLDRNFGGVYTPDACVFRGLEKDGYPLLDEFFLLSFIAVPAMNRPNLDYNGNIVPSLVNGIKNKMRTILRIGLRKGHDALVLGAWGCGAFRNPPSHIASLFHEILEEVEFKNKYRKIVFAILEDHNSRKEHNREGNLIPFKREFGNNVL